MATQEGLIDGLVNYYDIMILGKTGMGKSTTTDKLLMANPTGRNYLQGDGQQNNHEGVSVDENEGKVKADDFSMWILSQQQYEEERVRTRLKNLVFYRSLSNILEEVNKAREAGMNAFAATKECELLSNETTKVRVLDVPGFFDGDALKQHKSKGSSALDDTNLELMRKILHIQAAVRLKVRRILYFLPVPGPLTRKDAILISELKWMCHFFGRSIFDVMVLVITMPKHFSEMTNLDDDVKCPQDVKDKCTAIFLDAMKDMFPDARNDLKSPPIVFLAMTDSCERILEKVQEAQVHNEDGLQLQCDRNTCADCGLKTTVADGKGVSCYSLNEDEAIPYADSKCHPLLVPRFSSKIRHGFLRVFGRAAVLQGEYCVGCKNGPNSPGCMKVGKTMKRKFRKGITVDHSNKLTQFDEDAEENDPPEPIHIHHEEPARGQSPTVGNSVPGATASYTNPTYRELMDPQSYEEQ